MNYIKEKLFKLLHLFRKRKIDEIVTIFRKNHLFMSRIVCGSKSGYCRMWPDHYVIFNSNAIVKSCGKVWYGDVDLTKEGDILKKIAKEIKEDIFILRESDARFNNENRSFKWYKERAVWSTKDGKLEKF